MYEAEQQRRVIVDKVTAIGHLPVIVEAKWQ